MEHRIEIEDVTHKIVILVHGVHMANEHRELVILVASFFIARLTIPA